MPIRISHLPEHKLIISRPFGSVSTAEINKAWRAFHAAHIVRPDTDAIVDHRLVTEYRIDANQMMGMALQHAQDVATGLAPARVAQYCPRDTSFGMGRMFELTMPFDADAPVQVFSDIEAVAEWLGRSAADITSALNTPENEP